MESYMGYDRIVEIVEEMIDDGKSYNDICKQLEGLDVKIESYKWLEYEIKCMLGIEGV